MKASEHLKQITGGDKLTFSFSADLFGCSMTQNDGLTTIYFQKDFSIPSISDVIETPEEIHNLINK